jgi:mannosyl-oligosaccharide alpha-1,2-mannosidase
MDVFYKANVTDGLFHDEWSMEDGKPRGRKFVPTNHTVFLKYQLSFLEHFTIGATADSGYEYLLKQWVQSGDLKARQQCKQKRSALFFSYPILQLVSLTKKQLLDIKSATGIINNLIYQTPTRGLLYAGDISHGSLDHRLEHLSCYLPGVLALGAFTLPDTELPPKQKEIHRWAAHGLAYTCAISYADQESGLGPDQMKMSGKGRRWMEVVEEWELGGREGGDVPGMGEPEPERYSGKRDYSSPYPNAYFLRPEVRRNIFFFSFFFPSAHFFY